MRTIIYYIDLRANNEMDKVYMFSPEPNLTLTYGRLKHDSIELIEIDNDAERLFPADTDLSGISLPRVDSDCNIFLLYLCCNYIVFNKISYLFLPDNLYNPMRFWQLWYKRLNLHDFCLFVEMKDEEFFEQKINGTGRLPCT